MTTPFFSALFQQINNSRRSAAQSPRTENQTSDKRPQAAAAPARITQSADTEPHPIFDKRADLKPQNAIDKAVFAKLESMNIRPANLCSDAVFLRRAYIDVIGTLPTASEARQFLTDTDPDKRAQLIDRLLEREEYADYLAMKWCDLLRVKAEFPINLWPNAVQAYHRWIRTSIKENLPYDQFVRELLTASGSNFRKPQVNFYRAIQGRDPKSIAGAVALSLMGARAENWPKERLDGMATFFSQIAYKSTGEWKEEILFFDASIPLGGPDRPASDGPPKPSFPDGTVAEIPAGADPREVFADWLITPGNPWFVKNVVNRLWCWLLGRGIIHEPDDIRDDNPPSNPELLAVLEKEFISNHADTKGMLRLILNSNAYQLSSIPRSDHPDAAKYFASYPLRRLDAEVLIDALCQISGTSEEYTSAIPEPFTFIPDNQRSIELPDGSITSAFLELFGRPPRDTGLDSERNNQPTPAQVLHLLNSSHIQKKIEQSPGIQRLLSQPANAPGEAVALIYLTILSRFPQREEYAVIQNYSQSGNPNRREATIDLIWALINSTEFLYRH